MKILQLTAHFSPNVGGVETHLDDLVKALVKRSNEIFVLTYKPLTAKAKAQIWEKDGNLTVVRLPWITGFFYRLIANPILEFIYLFPGLFFVLPFVLLYFKPKVIHTHGLVAGFVGVFWGKFFGIRTITTTHSVYHFPKKGLYSLFARKIFNSSDHILTLSKESRKELEKLGIKSDKITVFTYWIDLTKFKPTKNAKKKLGWEKFTVLFVGRLVEEKGVLVLLKSLENWNENIQLVIIGTGPLESNIKKLELQNPNLHYIGKVANDKLPLYYSAADVVIVPSIHDEGFGRVILESLACGTPVIGSNRGAIPEAMNNNVGKLIEATSTDIAKCVNGLCKNNKLLKYISDRTVKYAAMKYSQVNLTTITSVYE